MEVDGEMEREALADGLIEGDPDVLGLMDGETDADGDIESLGTDSNTSISTR
jgi:hypothetical protein